MNQITACLLLTSLIFLTGCASLYNNKSQPVRVNTPENKTVMVDVTTPDQAFTTVAPTVIYAMPSSFKPLSIQINDPCYAPELVTVDTHINPIFWANVFTMLYGFPIDYLTGKMWDYEGLVNLPLKPKTEGENEDCRTQNYVRSQIQPPMIPAPRWYKHHISFGWGGKTRSKRYPDNYSAISTFLEYSLSLSADKSLAFRGSINSHYDDVWEDSCNKECYSTTTTQIHTQQTFYAVSLRQYLTPKADFYVGLGIARVNVDMEINNWGSRIASDEIYNISAKSGTAFMDFGWQARSGPLSFSVNAMLDLADLRFSTPKSPDTDSNWVKYRDQKYAQRAKNYFLNAGIISNITAGITLAF